MAFIAHAQQAVARALPYGQQLDPVSKSISDYILKKPPPAPGVPNPNDAMNAAQQQTDAMRQRRGMLANIFAGAQNTQPVTGKTQLGT